MKKQPKTSLLALLLGLALAGCGSTPKTVLDSSQGFSVSLPSGFAVDELSNPVGPTTTTWFRADQRALVAVDIVPLAGPRHSKLLELGQRGYLDHLAGELESDLKSNLKVFADFESQIVTLEDRPALEATFLTEQQGQGQRAYLLVAVSDEQTPSEIMLDYRFPAEETDKDEGWASLLGSVRWVAAQPSASPSASASASPKATSTPSHGSTPPTQADAGAH